MRIAIIGAGFGGLSAAYYLSRAGVDVTVFEAGDQPGGLASGSKDEKWNWTLEHHYHHFFTNDNFVLNLAKEVGQKIVVKSPISATYFNDASFRFDSPASLLKFSKLSLIDRLRTGSVIAFLKSNPHWKYLEMITSEKFIKLAMGKTCWDVLWKPLFVKKFGDYCEQINASWFWARIHKRTKNLAYPEGGFLSFAKNIDKEIIINGGNIFYGYSVLSVASPTIKQFNHLTMKNVVKTGSISKSKKIEVETTRGKFTFDKVICTLSTKQFIKVTKNLPNEYINKYSNLKSLGAINLVLSLKEELLSNNTYWLNVNELNYPFVSVVEHTNFMDKSFYNGEHLVYIGNYLPSDHKYFLYDEKMLLKEFTPYLKKINKNFGRKMVRKAWLFKDKFAQPVVGINHSKNIPPFETPIANLYLCNMQQVYPWDRGTSYAVENGERVARLVIGK